MEVCIWSNRTQRYFFFQKRVKGGHNVAKGGHQQFIFAIPTQMLLYAPVTFPFSHRSWRLGNGGRFRVALGLRWSNQKIFYQFLDDLEHIPDLKYFLDLKCFLDNKTTFLILNVLLRNFYFILFSSFVNPSNNFKIFSMSLFLFRLMG